MELKGAFAGVVLAFILAWWRGMFKPVREGENWGEISTPDYYWRV